MTDWIKQLLWLSLAMTVLAGAYYAATVLLRRRYAAKWFYLAGIILLIGLLIPVRLPFTLEQTTPPVMMRPTNQAAYTPQATADPPAIPAEASAQAPAAAPIDPWRIIFAIWATGAIGTLLFHTLRHPRFTHAVRRWSEPVRGPALLGQLSAAQNDLGIAGGTVQLMRCACVPGPMLLWMGRPTILLPERAMRPEDTRCILLHELVHYSRRDLLCRVLILLATAMHWFNPAIYLLCRLVTLQCEISCDERVVQNQDAQGKHQYAMSIIGVARGHAKRHTLLTTSFYGGKETMKKRITSIFEPAKRNAGIILLACALVMTLAAGSSIAVEQQAEGYTYLAVTSGYSPYTRIPGVPRGTDDSRIIQVTLTQHFTPFPLELPEGSGDAEEYAFVGVYVTFDEPFETEELDGYTSLVMPDGVLTCKDIEIIGPLHYGEITEIGEDYVVMDMRDDSYQTTGVLQRFTYTPDTYQSYESPFAQGSGCMLIAGEDGVALAMMEANG